MGSEGPGALPASRAAAGKASTDGQAAGAERGPALSLNPWESDAAVYTASLDSAGKGAGFEGAEAAGEF